VDYNILIIGGGAWGLSTAYNLSKKGVKNIAVLEKNYIASGQSGHTSAIVRQFYSSEITAKIAQLSLNFFKNFKNNIGYDAKFKQTGLIVVSYDKDSIMNTVNKLTKLDIQYHILDKTSLSNLDPNLNLKEDEVAVYEPEAGYADPIETTWAFAKASKEMGVKILEGEKVVSIQKEDKYVVKTSTKEYKTSKLLIAAGVDSPKIVSNLNINLPIYLIPFPVCYIKRPNNFESLNYVFFDFSVSYYTRPEGEDQIVVGAVHPQMSYSSAEGYEPDEAFHWSKINTEVASRPDYETLKAYTEGLLARFNNLKDVKIVRDLMPYIDITPDWEPIIDEVEEDLFVACGSSGHGFKLSPIVGRILADLISEKEVKFIDINPYSIKRFKL